MYGMLPSPCGCVLRSEEAAQEWLHTEVAVPLRVCIEIAMVPGCFSAPLLPSPCGCVLRFANLVKSLTG